MKGIPRDLLRELGLATVPEMPVEDLSAALEAARSLGYPVVLKGRSPGSGP